jgi:hypothetical protein
MGRETPPSNNHALTSHSTPHLEPAYVAHVTLISNPTKSPEDNNTNTHPNDITSTTTTPFSTQNLSEIENSYDSQEQPGKVTFDYTGEDSN